MSGRRRWGLAIGVVALALTALVVQRAQRPLVAPSLEVLLPAGGELPRDFVALARFDAPLDPVSVAAGLVYRAQRADGTFGPPHLVADQGDLLIRGRGRIIVFKVDKRHTPPVGLVLRVEFGRVAGANGIYLDAPPVEYVMTAGDPRDLYAALVAELGLGDLASIWREWIGEF